MKKPTRKKIVEKLDKVFSEYIRRRFAINDIAECVTCGKRDHWKQLQAGHFMSRKHYATRWDEQNVQVQCSGCNVFRAGEQYKYSLFLGSALSAELLKRSRQIKKFTNHELLAMIEQFKEKILSL